MFCFDVRLSSPGTRREKPIRTLLDTPPQQWRCTQLYKRRMQGRADTAQYGARRAPHAKKQMSTPTSNIKLMHANSYQPSRPHAWHYWGTLECRTLKSHMPRCNNGDGTRKTSLPPSRPHASQCKGLTSVPRRRLRWQRNPHQGRLN